MNVPLKKPARLLLPLMFIGAIHTSTWGQDTETARAKSKSTTAASQTEKSAKPSKSTASAKSNSPKAKSGKSTGKTASAAKSGKHGLDHSGRTRKGHASYYGRNFYGRTMADGSKMNPQSNVAASKTLPLGTKAEVTNLENGKTEVVEIKDRGPYVEGRIIDLSPRTAEKLDIKEQGVAPVAVTPIEVPLPDGSVKPGAASGSSGNGSSAGGSGR